MPIMKQQKLRIMVWVAAILGITLLGFFEPRNAPVLAQQPTGSIPTVTFRRGGNGGPATELRLDTGGDHFILARQ